MRTCPASGAEPHRRRAGAVSGFGRGFARRLATGADFEDGGGEDEALVLLFPDAAGNAVAARPETSSGHALLDAAAVRAARTLRSLPDSAPSAALLPVHFRLR
jgi:hypothetical protein